MRGGFKGPSKGEFGAHSPQKVMRDPHGHVVVRHPALPGPHMIPPSPDYAELPSGSMSSHNPPGGITGGLAPYQSEQGAERSDYANE